MNRSLLQAIAVAGIVLVAGCGGQPETHDVPVVDIQIDSITEQDTAVPDEGVQRPDNGTDEEVACVSGFGLVGEPEDPLLDADIVLSGNQLRNVEIFYRDCLGDDADRLVTFKQIDGEDVCSLQVQMDYTDKNGIALMPVQSDVTSGFCHIEACPDGAADQCITVTIYVEPKKIPPLRVRFDQYDGRFNVTNGSGTVRLYKKTPENQYPCSAMDPRNLPSPATVEKADVAIIGGLAVFSRLEGLGNEAGQVLSQDYTIVGLAYEAQDNRNIRAWACDDTGGHVEFGDMTTVILKLYDVVPSIFGEWDIDSNFDLISGLPPTVEKIINILIGLFVSPTGQILLLMCDESLLGFTVGETFCGYIFADPKNPKLGEYGTIGSFVINIVDQIIVNLLKNNCPYEDDPDLCSKIYFTGRDVGMILQKFRILSTMNCTKEPVMDWSDPDAGAIISKGDCTENWHTVVFRWSLGEDCDPADMECGAKYFSMSSIPGIGKAISAEISGRITEGQYLHIDQHAVNLKYGALINFALEKILLPQVFGDGSDGLPAVDTYEKLVGSLLAGRQCLRTMSCCADFDATLTQKYTWLPAGLAGGACEALLDTAVGFIRDQLNLLDATPENFTLGTPEDDPAQMFDTNNDMKFDTIGNQLDLANWEARLQIGSSVYDPIGLFWGIRN
ncbi:MAG TPA: hypothetical protein PLB35_03545 [Myxococcota bacterium]|nr:hypothetical protein [Myxococcota bacterium]HOA13168.1 hypothetical protein [Myxococcota bacterium]HOH76305.1 hypothetical protein [Myxococcota bacterium]HPV02952.1 hypothetical protein [Myxococcota bacterium]